MAQASRRALPAGLATALAISSGAAAQVLDPIELGGLAVGLGVEAGIAYLHGENTNFGLGRIDQRTGRNTGEARWGEGYLHPRLDLSYETEAAGSIYGAASAVATITRGGGDAGGFTANDDDLDLEQLHAGWRSGPVLAELLGEDGLDLSVGRQDFQVGDGFLIWDGNEDTGGDAAYWLAPRTAFELAAIARLNTEPLGGQVFYLRGDDDHGNAELVGLNLDHDTGFGLLGATYFRIVDAASAFDAEVPREGMDVVSVRANGLHLPGVEDATLHAEYVRQFGSGPNADFRAQAFYLEPAYTFSDVPWTPRLAYRFAYFSGDSDPEDARRRDFDPLFYGASRGWGTWFQGEIVGEYLLFNSNQINHMAHLSAWPVEEVEVGAIYFHFDLAEHNYFGEPVTSRRFADELNLYLDWEVSDNLFVGALYGAAFPARAAREVFGNQVFHLFVVHATVSF
jgi:hypothetical protein